jgi:hypothetical protein
MSRAAVEWAKEFEDYSSYLTYIWTFSLVRVLYRYRYE